VTTVQPWQRRRAAAAHVLVADVHRPELHIDDEHHLARVLRLRRGDEITVGDGEGSWRIARWTGTAMPEPMDEVMTDHRPHPRLTVAFAPTKGDRPEWVVQKLTELGIDRIIPVLTARSVVRWDATRAERQVERWRRIAREAVCQSRQVFLPVIEPVTELKALVRAEPVCVAEPGAPIPTADATTVVVGPEGGFTPEELSWATRTVGLPGGVLRTETAAVAVGVLMAADRSRGASS
jgi:16S rRNA (uracil1498-N3)-methyltransferase